MYFHHADPAHPAAQYDDVNWSPRCIECDGETQHSKTVNRYAGSHYDEFTCTEDGCDAITTLWNEEF
jgi:hypothetical protein